MVSRRFRSLGLWPFGFAWSWSGFRGVCVSSVPHVGQVGQIKKREEREAASRLFQGIAAPLSRLYIIAFLLVGLYNISPSKRAVSNKAASSSGHVGRSRGRLMLCGLRFPRRQTTQEGSGCNAPRQAGLARPTCPRTSLPGRAQNHP